jgi:deoxyribodipyrimidine photolyase-like uncharacterized protein
MTFFRGELARRQGRCPGGRRWLFVPYDQLTDQVGPLSREAPKTLGIVLVENPWKPSRRPYHKQKLALIIANLRHFALEQADRGVAVRHVIAGRSESVQQGQGDFREGREGHTAEFVAASRPEPQSAASFESLGYSKQ